MIRKALLATVSIAFLSAILAVPSQAGTMDHPSHQLNPDKATSILFLAGMGNADGEYDTDADVTSLNLMLVHPMGSMFSFVAEYEYEDMDWSKGMAWRDVNVSKFSLGLKLYIR